MTSDLIISQKLYVRMYDKFCNDSEFKFRIINFNQHYLLSAFLNRQLSFGLNQFEGSDELVSEKPGLHVRLIYIRNELDDIIVNYNSMNHYMKINNIEPIWDLYNFKTKIDNLYTFISPDKLKHANQMPILNKLVNINADLSIIDKHYHNEYISRYIKDIKDQLKNIEHDYLRIDVPEYTQNETGVFVNLLSHSKSPGFTIMKTPSPLIQEDEICEECENDQCDLSDILNADAPLNNDERRSEDESKGADLRSENELKSVGTGDLKSDNSLEMTSNLSESQLADNSDSFLQEISRPIPLSFKIDQSPQMSLNDENVSHLGTTSESQLPNSSDLKSEALSSENLGHKLLDSIPQPSAIEHTSPSVSIPPIITEYDQVTEPNQPPTTSEFSENIVIPLVEYNQLLKDSEDYNKLMPFKTFSSQKLGVIGETFISDILTQLGYRFENTTKIAHVGDIRITFDNFIIMFEIKNKKTITQEDITKFKSDIFNLKKITGKPVCGCFISLVSNNILNISTLQFDMHETYIPHDSLNISTIQIYIESLRSMFSSNNDDIISVKNKLNDQLINYSRELEICQRHADYSIQLNKDMIEMKMSLSNKLDTLKMILSGIDPSFSKELSLKHELMEYVSRPRWTLKECKNIVNKYGVMIALKNKNDVVSYINSIH